MLTTAQKDSIKYMVCEMECLDQAIRASIITAQERKDTTALDSMYAEMYIIDKRNFTALQQVMETIGFPCPKLLGKNACYPFGIFIHWCKEYPEWFNKPEMVALIKKEIDRGHLPKCQADLAQFMYISFTDADMKDFELVNNARLVYGLKPYTKKQFLKEEWAEPMMSDKEPEVPRSSN